MIFGFALMPVNSYAEAPYLTAETFVNLAQETAGAVVNIGSERKTETDVGKSPYREFVEKFFEAIPEPLKIHNLGSGFIMDPLGYMLTNNHVVEEVLKSRLHKVTDE